MSVEIDQSGKIEQLDTVTVIACANDVTHALCIKVQEKRKLFLRLRTSMISKQDKPALLFAILVFLLLRQLKQFPRVIIIDEEWTGKNVIISRALLRLLQRQKIVKQRIQISFKQIGKHSSAHRVAWSFHRTTKQRREMFRVTADEVLKFWK